MAPAQPGISLCDGLTSEDSISARSVRRPGLSQNDCFPGKGSDRGPADEDTWIGTDEGMCRWDRGKMTGYRPEGLAAEARKAGIFYYLFYLLTFFK